MFDPITNWKTGLLNLTNIGNTTTCVALTLSNAQFITSAVIYYNAKQVTAVYFYASSGFVVAMGTKAGASTISTWNFTSEVQLAGFYGF